MRSRVYLAGIGVIWLIITMTFLMGVDWSTAVIEPSQFLQTSWQNMVASFIAGLIGMVAVYLLEYFVKGVFSHAKPIEQ